MPSPKRDARCEGENAAGWQRAFVVQGRAGALLYTSEDKTQHGRLVSAAGADFKHSPQLARGIWSLLASSSSIMRQRRWA
jgi:hypothetical protein